MEWGRTNEWNQLDRERRRNDKMKLIEGKVCECVRERDRGKRETKKRKRKERQKKKQLKYTCNLKQIKV